MIEEFNQITYHDKEMSFLGMIIEPLILGELFLSSQDMQSRYAEMRADLLDTRHQEMQTYSQMWTIKRSYTRKMLPCLKVD
jgi:hypothetical protein